MAAPLPPRWEIIEVGRTTIDDGQILIVDRTNDADRRTVSIVVGRLARDGATGNFQRVLDAEAETLRLALSRLLDWASDEGGCNEACWTEARALLQGWPGRDR